MLLEYELFYPDEARRQGMEGTAHLRVLVNSSGLAEQVSIAQTSGNLILDSAALRTAATFKFSPAVSGGRSVPVWVMVPIEFRFREVDFNEWLTEAEVLQRRIARQYDDAAVEELYELYRQMIFSPWGAEDLAFNDYIKQVVTERAAVVWTGYWSVYPARIVLFVDLIVRYPDSFAALKARADLGEFLDQEKIKMRHGLDAARADTLVARIQAAVRY